MPAMNEDIIERQITRRLHEARLMQYELNKHHREEYAIHNASLDLSIRDLERYSFSRAIKCLILPVGADHTGSFERECSNTLAQRFDIPLGCLAVPSDMLAYRGPRPSYTVGASAPDALSFMDMLRNASVAFRLGTQLLTDLKNDVAVPRQVSDPTMTWLAPGSSGAPSDSNFGQLSATPKQALVITEVSEQLLRQSSADRIIKAGLAAVIGVGIDAAVINGSGGSQPLGLLNAQGIPTASGTSLAYAGLVGLQKTVADANAILDPTSLGYATTPTVAEQLKNRQRFTSTDSPLWAGALHHGTIEGVPAMASKQMPTGSLLYGDWSTVYVSEWGPLVLGADRGGTRFNQGLVGIRAYWLVDVILTSPSSFVKVTSIT